LAGNSGSMPRLRHAEEVLGRMIASFIGRD